MLSYHLCGQRYQNLHNKNIEQKNFVIVSAVMRWCLTKVLGVWEEGREGEKVLEEREGVGRGGERGDAWGREIEQGL